MTATTLPIRDLTELCACVRELLDAKACVCAVVDADEGRLEFVAGEGAGVDRLVGQVLQVGEGITGYVALAGVPVEVPEVRTDERLAAGLGEHVGYVPDRMIAVPLADEAGQVIGVLNVLDPSTDATDEATAAVGGALPALAVVAGELAPLLC